MKNAEYAALANSDGDLMCAEMRYAGDKSSPYCSLPVGHRGDHIAYMDDDMDDREIYTKWKNIPAPNVYGEDVFG